jgi:hypothetical protein
VFFAAIGAMWLAPFAQRVAGGKASPLAIIVVAFGMLGASFSSLLVVLALAMLVASVGSDVTDVLINARVAETEARSGRTLMNLNHAMYSFAYAGAALLAGVLREAQVDLRIAFAGLVVVLLALAYRAQDVIPNIEDDDVGGAGQMPHALVVMAGLVVLVAFLAEASAEGWSALHLERTLGGTPGEGALGPALLGLMMGLIAQGFGLRTAFVVVAALLALTAVVLIPALARRAR